MAHPRFTPDHAIAPSAGVHIRPAWVSGVLCVLLVAATVIAYQPAWQAGFIWDDDVYVTNNSLLTAPDGLRRIWFSLDSPSQYFPLTYTIFRLERALWGLNAAGYHWVNILLHAANALLVWRLLRRLAVPGAWLAAALFALHPVNVESVAWVTELKNVLSLFFSLLTLMTYASYVSYGDRPAARFYWLSLLFYALALCSKTTACTLPAAMVLVLWLKRQPLGWRRLAQLVPFVAMGLAMGGVAIWWERHQQGTEGKIFALGFLDRLLVAGRAIWFYAGKLIWPVNLSFSYPRWTINPSGLVAYGWLAAGAGLGVAIYYARRFAGRSLEVAALFYVATLSPMLGFIMLYTFHYTFVADHYQYVAMIGPVALVAAGITTALNHLKRSGQTATGQSAFSLLHSAIVLALLATLGVLTWRQCSMYIGPETLWRTTLARNPDSFMAANNLGEWLLQQGRWEEAVTLFQKTLKIEPASAKARCNLGAALLQGGRPEDAIREYQKALELQPDLAAAHKNLGDVCLQLGRVEEALAHAREAVELQPGFAEAHNTLGNALLQQGNVDAAIGHWQKAVELQPDYLQALNNLGVALTRKGKTAEAMARFQKAVDLQPGFAEAQNNLGKLKLQQGQVREALAHYQSALQAQPDDPDTLCNLAWVLATWPEDSVRDGAQAVKLAQRANELTGSRSPAVLGTLAAAYAEAGRFAEAVTAAQRALQLAESRSDAMLADMLRAQLRFHQNGLPVRDPMPADTAGDAKTK